MKRFLMFLLIAVICSASGGAVFAVWRNGGNDGDARLAECLDGSVTSEQVECYDEAIGRRQEEIAAACEELTKSLDDKGIAELKESQARWLNYLEAEKSLFENVTQEEGSSYSVLYLDYIHRLYKARAADLADHLRRWRTNGDPDSNHP